MGATFNIAGEIRLGTAGLSEGVKQARSEMASLSQSGIAGFEAAQQKVIDLTKQVASLKAQLLQTNDPAAQAKLNTSLAQTQRELSAAKTQMRGMTLESREASEKAALLAAQFGVAIPSGLGRLLSRLPAVGAALEAAFPVVIIGAFAAAILSGLPPVQKLIDKWHDLGKASEEALKDAIAANEKLLVQPASTAQGNAFLEQTNRELAALQKKRDALERIAFNQSLSNLLTQADIVAKVRLGRVDDQIADLEKRRREQQEGLVGVGHKELDLDAKIAAKKLELNGIRAQGIDKLRVESQAAIQALQFEQRGVDESKRAYYDRLIALQRSIEAAKQNTEAIKRTRDQTAFLAAEELKRVSVSATAADKIRLQLDGELRKIDELEKFRELSHADAEARRVAITRTATEQIKQAIDQEARQLAALGDAANQAYQGIEDTARRTENDVTLKSAEFYSKQRGGVAGFVSVTAQGSGQILAIKQRESEDLIQLDRQVADARTKLQSKVFQSAEEQSAATEALEDQAAKARVAIEQKAGLEIALAQREAIERTAQQIESFIDRVFMQARSISDVFHQFLMQMLGSFIKWVSRMIAEAILGMRQVSGSTGTTSGGGVLGSILGTMLGLRPGTTTVGGQVVAGGAVASSLAPGIQGAFPAIAELPLESNLAGVSTLDLATLMATGRGASPAGTAATQIVGGATQGAFGKAAFAPWKLVNQLAPVGAGLGLMGGVQMVAGSGGPISGGVGGAVAAASGAALVGATMGATGGIAGAVAALSNPITAIVVGAAFGIGALIGALRRGRQKRQATTVANEFQAAADEVVEQFKEREADYDSALEALRTLAQNEVAKTQSLGSPGHAAASGIETMERQREDAINTLQRQREARGETISAMTLPEFHQGGIVGAPGRSPGLTGGLTGGEVLAILEAGEGVVNVDAMQRLGEAGLAAINRAPHFHEGGTVVAVSPSRSPGSTGGPVVVNVSFQAFDGPSMQSWWRTNQANVVRTLRRAVRDGG